METIKFIGYIKSPLKELKDCPLQEAEGAPQVMLCIAEEYRPALQGLSAGDKVMLLTWLDKGDRTCLTTRPRNNPNAPLKGVFATRSPNRPNPIGLHVTAIVAITDEGELIVANLEVLDGTPLIDIKPVI